AGLHARRPRPAVRQGQGVSGHAAAGDGASRARAPQRGPRAASARGPARERAEAERGRVGRARAHDRQPHRWRTGASARRHLIRSGSHLTATERRPDMERPITEVITREVMPVVRVALRETTELRAAVQLLGERIDALTEDLTEGGLSELIRLAAGALRRLETHNGRRRP